MTRRTLSVTVVICLCAGAMLLCGCSKKTVPAAGERGANRSDGKVIALENQKRFKTRAELREYLAQKIICPAHNMNLIMDEKSAPECDARRQILIAIDRMIDSGWTIEEIEATIPLLRQGQSMMVDIPNEKSCLPDDGSIRLDFFVMSHCPYGLRYEDQVLPSMLAELGQLVKWEPHFVVDIDAKGNINSMHGQPELDEDKFQICVAREIGNATWLSYARCYASEISRIYQQSQAAGKQPPDEKTVFAGAHNTCAARAGVNPAAVAECVKSRSADLLRKDNQLSKRWSTHASPSAVFNCNVKFQGGAVPYADAKPYICSLFPKDKLPAVCASFK